MTPRPTASPPLIKVTFLLCLILATSLLTSWRLLLAVTAVGLFLVRRAGIPPGTLARRLLWLAYLSAGLLLTLTLLVPGSPLLKAYDRSERIYRAMLSRGYSIRQAPAAARGLSGRERWAVAGAVAAAAALVLLDRRLRGGG